MATSLKRANSRRVSIAAALAVILSFAPVLAQIPAPAPPSDAKPASKQPLLTLRGCLQGSVLSKIEPKGLATSAPPEVRLTANRATRNLMKEHNGAYVDVTGTLKDYDNMATGGLTVKETDKTRVYLGATEKRSPRDDFNRPTIPAFDVSSLSVVAPTCQAR